MCRGGESVRRKLPRGGKGVGGCVGEGMGGKVVGEERV